MGFSGKPPSGGPESKVRFIVRYRPLTSPAHPNENPSSPLVTEALAPSSETAALEWHPNHHSLIE
jgi:hypothetical protein